MEFTLRFVDDLGVASITDTKNATVSASPSTPNITEITNIIQSKTDPVFLIVGEDIEWSIGDDLSSEQLDWIESVNFQPGKFAEFLTFESSSLIFNVEGSSLTSEYEL